jgi:hypothetical protein
MFLNKDLTEEEREKIVEERKRKRQEFFKTLGSTVKQLLGDFISTASEILYPEDSSTSNLFLKSDLKENIVYFWDYENFALPKSKIADDMFFKMIYPSKKKYKVIAKRVFSKKSNIEKHLQGLMVEGFRYYETTSTEKNATDKALIQNCLDFCSNFKDNLVVFLITGDSDYISLIKKLVYQGHEVRLIFSSKDRISKEMERLVPNVLDIKSMFEKRKKTLEKKLSKKEDSSKWELLWDEYVALEEDSQIQEQALNRIAQVATSIKIRSRAQSKLIGLIESKSNN